MQAAYSICVTTILVVHVNAMNLLDPLLAPHCWKQSSDDPKGYALPMILVANNVCCLSFISALLIYHRWT